MLIWLLIALMILLILLLVIIFTKLTVIINYYHHNDNDDLKLELKIWFGIIKYKINVPLIKIDDNSPSVVVKGNTHIGNSSEESDEMEQQITPNKVKKRLKDLNEILKHVNDMFVIIKKLLQKMTIKQFEWHSLLGVGDAAFTGMATGALWTIKSSVISILSHFLKLKEMPVLSVTPQFQFAVIQTRLTCIIQFRIGYAILAGLKLIKFWKGGRPNLEVNNTYSKEKTKTV
jgi:hypothetical protein